MWTCDHKAHDKMAFLCLCPLGSQEQLVAGGGLGRSCQYGIVDVEFLEQALQLYLLEIVNLQLWSHGPQGQETVGS